MNEAQTNGCEPVDLAGGNNVKHHAPPVKLTVLFLVLAMALVLVIIAFASHRWFLWPEINFLPRALFALSGQENETSGEFQRGVASSVVKYADKDYTKASWKLVYDIRKLPNSDAVFHTMAGWDKQNLIIHGEVSYTNEGAARLLVLKLKDGEWKPSDQEADGHYAKYKALFLGKNQYLFYYEGRGPFPGNLVNFNKDKMDVLSKSPVPVPVEYIYLTDEKSVCFSGRFGSSAWLYKLYEPLQRIERVDSAEDVIAMDGADAQKIQTCKQQFAFSSTDLTSFDLSGAVKFVKCFSPGNAAGLIQEGAYESPACGPHKSPVMMVEYRGGKWHLNQLITQPQAEVQATWFLDQSNCITAGRFEINIITGANVSSQKIVIGNNDYTDQDFSAVWGKSVTDFFVMNCGGDVFHFADGVWNLAVKVPDLKHEPTWNQADGDDVFELRDNKFKFNQVWISPDGAAFGLRRKTVYMLD